MYLINIRLFSSFLLGADRSATRHIDCKDDGIARGDRRNILNVKVFHLDSLVDVHVADVHLHIVRQILNQTANLDFLDTQFGFATTHDTGSRAFEGDGQHHCDWFVFLHDEEVGVQDLVGHRMILDVLKDGLVNLAIDVEINDVGLRSEKNLGETFFGCGKVNLLLAGALHDTRNHRSLTQSLSILFPYVLAERTAQ